MRGLSRFAAAAALGAALTLGAAAAQAQNSTWQEIKERGALRIGVTQGEPWFFKDPQTQQWSGLGISLGKALAGVLGVKLDYVEVTWGNAIAALEADKIDTMFVQDATPKRALAVDFIEGPMLYYALAVLIRDDNPAKSWKDLDKKGTTVSVTMGTTIDTYVTKNLPNATILRFPSNDETVAAFQSGRADAAAMFHPPLTMLQRKLGSGRIILPTPIRFSASSAAIRREPDKTWRDWLSTAIAYYYTTGEMETWYDEFLKSRGIDPAKVPGITRENWKR